jgi:SET domain-containing protein
VNDVAIKTSRIHGRGVYAARRFEAGETVIAWHPRELTRKEYEALPQAERVYIEFVGDRILFLQEPERYVNHSCDPNTEVRGQCDVASRAIEPGEEIASDYAKTDTPAANFVCSCGSPKCRGVVKPKNSRKI